MDDQDFKSALSQFGSGVTVITVREKNGTLTGFTASSFTSLSLNPPLVLFCLSRDSTSFEALNSATHFGVNILTHSQQNISNQFAQRGGDKFENVEIWDGESSVPLIRNSLVNLECRARETFPGGDHLIFVGEVTHTYLGQGEPLLFYMGKYHTL